MEKKIAIIIPAYKSRFLRQTLNSIAAQTCRSFTIYIGDDASPQHLDEIVSDYMDRMDIVYKRFENNLGKEDLAGHWDRCIALSKESVIWFFSDDDLMPQDGVERIMQALHYYGEKNRIFRFPLSVVDALGEVIQINPLLSKEKVSGYQFLVDKLEGKIYSAACEYVFTRDVYTRIGGFIKFPLAWCSDDATWASLGEISGGIIPLLGKPVSWRNVEGENISCSVIYDREKLIATGGFIKWIVAFYSNKLQDEKLRHAIKNYIYTILCYSLQERYTLYDLWKICRVLWKISPSVSFSVAFRMCKLKLKKND